MSSTTRAHIEVHPTGQSIGLVSGGASIQVSGDAVVDVTQATPITKQGEEMIVPDLVSGAAQITMTHGVWVVVPDEATACVITPSGDSLHVKTMHVSVLGAAKPTLTTGTIEWIGGEPTLSPDTRYTIIVRQLGSKVQAFVEINFTLS